MYKKISRLKRALRSRYKIRLCLINRLCVHRTLKHIYAQVISPNGTAVLAQASTLDKSFRGIFTGNVGAAYSVGLLIGERTKFIGIKNVAFDRSGFKYHGRVKALAEAARESGLSF